MSTIGTSFRSLARNYRIGAVTVGISPARNYATLFPNDFVDNDSNGSMYLTDFIWVVSLFSLVLWSNSPAQPTLNVTNDYLTPNNYTMPALNLIEDEAVRPDRSPFEYLLDYPQVRIRNLNLTEKKLQQIVAGGREKLLVISDFDMTLSRAVDDNGESCWTTHGVFDNCANEVDPSLGGKFAALKAKYHPIEFCPKMTMEEKIPFMEEWWNSSHNYIVKAGFERSRIQKFVEKAKILLRTETERMMARLEQANIPLVVFSAGLGNIIEMYFDHKFNRKLNNMHLISNMMRFDDQDKVVGFSEPLIHTFCKNSSVIRKDERFFHEVSQRVNVILLGDSMGDIHMDVGVEKDGPTLRIGFLNSNVENLLDQYMDAYDIVIIQDQTMTVPAQVIDHVLFPQKMMA